MISDKVLRIECLSFYFSVLQNLCKLDASDYVGKRTQWMSKHSSVKKVKLFELSTFLHLNANLYQLMFTMMCLFVQWLRTFPFLLHLYIVFFYLLFKFLCWLSVLWNRFFLFLSMIMMMISCFHILSWKNLFQSCHFRQCLRFASLFLFNKMPFIIFLIYFYISIYAIVL